ncbi:MAG: hypothetical protein HC927_00175 [Deltaproteobacteria bacterium]|nr:hypothetical protein [Deltaproteobacteria bacterium]
MTIYLAQAFDGFISQLAAVPDGSVINPPWFVITKDEYDAGQLTGLTYPFGGPRRYRYTETPGVGRGFTVTVEPETRPLIQFQFRLSVAGPWIDVPSDGYRHAHKANEYLAVRMRWLAPGGGVDATVQAKNIQIVFPSNPPQRLWIDFTNGVSQAFVVDTTKTGEVSFQSNPLFLVDRSVTITVYETDSIVLI